MKLIPGKLYRLLQKNTFENIHTLKNSEESEASVHNKGEIFLFLKYEAKYQKKLKLSVFLDKNGKKIRTIGAWLYLWQRIK